MFFSNVKTRNCLGFEAKSWRSNFTNFGNEREYFNNLEADTFGSFLNFGSRRRHFYQFFN